MKSNDQQEFKYQEATITTIQKAFSLNKLTSTQLINYYLNQIETLNPLLHAVIEINPHALDIAKRADQTREAAARNGVQLSALHGIPVFLKDTIGTNDELGTTAGSYALLGSKVARDATVVEKLRDVGAVILGKASLSEWYKIRSIDHLPNAWCARAGQGVDARDEEATSRSSKFIPQGGYKQFLNKDGLKGKRLGIVRHPCVSSLHGSSAAKTFERNLEILRERGAILVEDLEILNVAEILNPNHSGEITAMLADFKHSISGYLKELESSPVRSLADIIAFNENNAELEKTKEYGQDGFIKAENMHGNEEEISEIVEYLDKLCKGFEKMMEENELDAMVTPGTKAIPIMAIGGYPGITVPAGYDEHGVPFGMLFSGIKGSEPKLIEMAYGFEQATLARKPPLFDSPEWHVDN